MHLLKGKDDSETTVMFFARDDATPQARGAVDEVLALLGVRPGIREVKVAYGLLPADDREIRMLTRSILQIMVALGLRVEVPEKNVADGRTVPASPRGGAQAQQLNTALIDIGNSLDRPDDAFVAVQ